MKDVDVARRQFRAACLDGAPVEAAQWLDGLDVAMEETILPLAEKVDREAQYPDVGVGLLRELGALGVSAPRHAGGLGHGPAVAAAAVEAAARCCPSTAAVLMFHLQVVRRTMRHASDALRSEDLPALIAGERLGVSAWSEPGAGADKKNVTTRLTAIDSRRFEAVGRKSFCTGLEGAAIVHALACVDDSKVPSFVRFAFDGAAVRPGEIYELSGLRGSSTGDVIIDGAVVDRDAILGELHTGPALMRDNHSTLMNPGLIALGIGYTTLSFLRSVMASEAPGLRSTLTFQNTRMVLATIGNRLAQAYALAASCVRAIRADPADADLLTLQVKVAATDAAVAVTEAAVSMCGASGFRSPWPIERYLRDARASRLMGPTNEVIRDQLGLAWSGE